ncbi:MAG: UDP-N-acetylmuramoyl-L-alanine--D-glutamate ligase [Melioribacter sp.]|nr:UDP-N-acetylmuramoyl-L-alanine--D-glutamate ligase [Melioribacter sp.]
MNIEGKKISIIGAVRSGIGAAKLAKKMNAIPFVSDSGSWESLQKSIEILQKEGIDYEIGLHSDKVYDCDLIITSPGVPSDSEVLQKAKQKGIEVISELEFASWFCKGTIISITGTNGKTTTTSLMNYTLNECGLKSYSAGNIGNAFSEIVLNVKENEFVALETSSFQLDFVNKFNPKFAILLNITPDHLDRYNNNFEEYIAAKFNISKNQNEDDFFIYNADDLTIVERIKDIKARKIGFSLYKKLEVGAYYRDGKICFAWYGKHEEVCNSSDLFIKGEHNIANTLAVLAVAKILNLPNRKIKNSFSTFRGVEHRIEFVRELDGVEYYNDSKATNVDSVWYALKSFDKPIYLILGGKDKGNNYDKIKDLVIQKVKKIYAIGSSANKIYEYFKNIVPTEYMQTIENCVETARKEAEPGSVVLLSPACASFDMFDNYEHRGKVFKTAVKNLK